MTVFRSQIHHLDRAGLVVAPVRSGATTKLTARTADLLQLHKELVLKLKLQEREHFQRQPIPVHLQQ